MNYRLNFYHNHKDEILWSNPPFGLLLMQLKGKLQNQNPSEGASNLKAQISALTNQLKEKTEELEESQNLNNVLTVKELTTRKELHDARKESISVY